MSWGEDVTPVRIVETLAMEERRTRRRSKLIWDEIIRIYIRGHMHRIKVNEF